MTGAPSNAANEVLERGFTSFEQLVDRASVERFGARMRELWREHGAPALFSQEDVILGERAHVSPVGLTIAGILEPIPEAAQILVRPELLSLFGELLGPDFDLELGAGVISDDTRPFFFWHHHVGGIDGEDLRDVSRPGFERAERLACTTYLSPLDDDHGTMLIMPRAITEPTAPPHPPGREPWPDAFELRCSPGTVVVLDQATWHAVTPMSRPGQRAFISFFVRRAGLLTVRRDVTLARALVSDPSLARHYGGSAQGGSR